MTRFRPAKSLEFYLTNNNCHRAFVAGWLLLAFWARDPSHALHQYAKWAKEIAWDAVDSGGRSGESKAGTDHRLLYTETSSVTCHLRSPKLQR